jgi:hypothetical protein
MEAATAATASVAKRSKRATLANGPVIASIVGAIVGIVGTFLKAFTPPAAWIAGGWHGSTTYLQTVGGAKVALGSLVIGVIFLLIARGTHRKGFLWGSYIFGAVAILMTVLAAAGGFTVTGSAVKASAGLGVYVALVGSVVMFVGAIAARQTATPDA